MNSKGFSDFERQPKQGMVSSEIVDHSMAQSEDRLDSTAMPVPATTEIEQALRRHLHELERLAVFYHKRGQTEQARELYHMMISNQQRLDADEQSVEQRRLCDSIDCEDSGEPGS
jgi:hypothetical protein